MSHDKITPKEVLSSQSVRLLNLAIDEAAAEISDYDRMIQSHCARIASLDAGDPENLRELRTRTYEEQQAGATCPGILDISSSLDNLASMHKLRGELVERVRQMQALKLRLLNDYDFTRGDDGFQKAVLRPEKDPA